MRSSASPLSLVPRPDEEGEDDEDREEGDDDEDDEEPSFFLLREERAVRPGALQRMGPPANGTRLSINASTHSPLVFNPFVDT